MLRKAWFVAGLLVAGSIAAAGTAVRAEVRGLHFTLSPYAGFTSLKKEVTLQDGFLYGARVGLMFGPYIGIEGTYGLSPTELTSNQYADVKLHHVGGDLMFKPFPKGGVQPYLIGGVAMVRTDPETGSTEDETGFEAGGGVVIAFKPRAAARIDLRDVAWEPTGTSTLTHNLFLSAGLQFGIFGSLADSDGDGVIDEKDTCAGTPNGVRVDLSGCPLDGDRDGVADGIDRCPDTPGGIRVDEFGCAVDSDGDGVTDDRDKCPGTPHGIRTDASGCAGDSDSDGVSDDKDRCENTPHGARVDPTGCPTDADGDGVYDGLDQCSNTPRNARVDSKGCPITVSEKETQLLDTGLLRLNNVNFDTGKSTIKPESYAVLDEVGQILARWDELKIEVGGHTDSQGDAAMNQKLSEDRAQAVADYLLSKFVDIGRDQFTVKGYGEGQSIADNKAAAGRAENRRVEFKVLNKEVLKKEIDKSRMLKEGEK